MQKKKKYFKIGEVSRLFHIGVDSIRYYEEIGILKPYRNPDNNYRLYTLDDLRKLTIIRELLSLNFSTEEIKQFEESRTVNSTIALFEKELNLINERIVDLLQQKDNILARISDIQNTLSLKEQQNIRLLDLPERHCIMVSPTNIPDSYLSYSLMEYMQSHPQRVDTIGTCDCYTLDIEGSNPDSDYYRTENVFFYSENRNYHSNYSLPAGKYLSLVYTGSLKKTKQLMPSLFDYARKHRLEITGKPIEFCRIDEYETIHEDEFITEIQLPVTPA